MNILLELRRRFAPALANLTAEGPSLDTQALLEMIRPATDTKFGDYQANLAMPLAKKLGKNP
ncbi:MAG: hypothetical protein WD045_04225, partial [Pirellulaceae bacterium]